MLAEAGGEQGVEWVCPLAPIEVAGVGKVWPKWMLRYPCEGVEQ